MLFSYYAMGDLEIRILPRVTSRLISKLEQRVDYLIESNALWEGHPMVSSSVQVIHP